MKYPFTPELLDALPEELAELFRWLELKNGGVNMRIIQLKKHNEKYLRIFECKRCDTVFEAEPQEYSIGREETKNGGKRVEYYLCCRCPQCGKGVLETVRQAETLKIVYAGK